VISGQQLVISGQQLVISGQRSAKMASCFIAAAYPRRSPVLGLRPAQAPRKADFQSAHGGRQSDR